MTDSRFSMLVNTARSRLRHGAQISQALNWRFLRINSPNPKIFFTAGCRPAHGPAIMAGQLAAASTMANPLTQALIDHIESNEVSIYLATCDTQRTPRGTRAYACRMATDGLSITTWIKKEGNDAVLANIRNSGRLALVICNVE